MTHSTSDNEARALRHRALAHLCQVESFLERHGGPAISDAAAAKRQSAHQVERLAAGGLGTCERCHDPIDEPTLRVQPEARFCLDCQTPQERRALERDIALAAAIQARFLPPLESELAGWSLSLAYHPLGAVSGDFCDHLERDGDLFVLFGDMAGKGIAASLLAAHLQALFRALVPLGLGLAELVQSANRLFASATHDNAYATVIAARLAPDGRMELINAGHCPPLLRHGGELRTLPATGLPIGLFSEASYQSHQLRLEGGDLLLLYTDGLSEAENPDGLEYGDRRARELLAGPADLTPRRLADDLLADLAQFCRGRHRQDDLSVLGVKRTTAPASRFGALRAV